FNNAIVLQPGIDSALQGFDVTWRFRPRSLGMVNGSFDLGGYGYRSDFIDFFGGGRARFAMQLLQGLVISAEVNQDERFDTTGVLQLAYLFGVNARGNEYSLAGRDLEPTLRNDHIVRYNQDVVLAIDPDTGAPYNVYHVDNTADPGFADGRAQTPFTTLAAAQAAAGTDAIIFVHEGNGTDFGMSNGIVLKDRQMLLGDGALHLIPLQGGTFFELCNDPGANRPVISGNAGGAAITLANDNVVRGIVVDGSAADTGYGILGNGVNNGVIEDVAINDAILHGIAINNFTGDWQFNRNDITRSGFDGMLLTNNTDPTSVLSFEDNDVSGNGRDGISLTNYDAAEITFDNNITDANGRDGVRLVNFLNTTGNGTDVLFLSHTARNNIDNGLHVNGGDGNLEFLNSLITGNVANGIRIQNWTNTNPTDRTLISSFNGGTSTITGNGIGSGAGIFNLLENGTQRLFIVDNTINGNGIGVTSIADNVTTLLTTEITDNSISNNNSDGVQLSSFGGASHFALIDNNLVNANGAFGGSGIRLIAGDPSATTSLLDVTVQNTAVTNTANGGGIVGDVIQDAQLNLFVDNSTISGNSGNGIGLDIDTIANLAINNLTVTNSLLNNNAGSAVSVFTGTDTFADIVVENSVLTNGGGNGVLVQALGNNAVAGVDNRTRAFIQNNQISGFTQDGIAGDATGDASLFMTINGNTITDNGPGTDPDALPFFSGIFLRATADASLNGRITNNLVTGNFDRGLLVETLNNANTALLLAGNNMSGNDLGEDLGNAPIVDSFLEDLNIFNGAGATTCVAMTNNFFTLDAVFTNAGGIPDFQLELDGVTNSFGGGAFFGGPIVFPAFGTVCVPAINAEAAAFNAAGFPVQ
ncbi:MAG: beta strand repeat-containing protein, partial [Planctomycetota bacterium]